MTRWAAVILLAAVAGCGAQPVALDGGSGGGAGGGSGGGAGGGGGGGTAATGCQTATVRLCDRASACGGGTKFIVATATATAEHLTLNDCKNYYKFIVCPAAEGDGGTRDWPACQTAIDAEACTTTAKGSAIPLPTTCAGLTL